MHSYYSVVKIKLSQIIEKKIKQSVANNSISIHFISTNQIYHYYFVFLCFGYHLLLQMSSSKPYSFVGRDSFDDLDSSLDKALHSASNNYFHSSNNAMAQGAIHKVLLMQYLWKRSVLVITLMSIVIACR